MVVLRDKKSTTAKGPSSAARSLPVDANGIAVLENSRDTYCGTYSGEIDLFSRRVVGWSMSAAMTAQLVIDALAMAIWRRGKPDALMHHSDRGSQYTSSSSSG
jgi:transposase InsO family protein